MHIVLSGYYGYDNTGDEAILFSIVKGLRALEPAIEITVLSNNPEATKEKYQTGAVDRWDPKEINRVLKQSDGLISGGGSLLQDETGPRSVPYYAGVMKLAQLHNKPVFVYAQGIGPVNRQINKWILKRVLNKVNMITVRDIRSRNFLKIIGVKQPVTVVPDPVLSLYGKPFQSQWINAQQLDSPFITVSVRDWPAETNFKKKIANALDELAGYGNKVVFIPMHGDYDLQASEEVASLMSGPSLIMPKDASMEEKIAVIGQSDLLIGMRLHALVFAAISSTPFIAISYDPKIDAFAALFDQPVPGHVANDDWDGRTLAAAARNVYSRLEEEGEAIRQKAAQHRLEALETPEAALRQFRKPCSFSR